MAWKYHNIEGKYTYILDGLAASSNTLQQLVGALPEGVLLEKPNGKWSIQEHAGHLLTIESLWIARLDDFVMRHESLRPWNGTNADTDQGQFNLQAIDQILEDFSSIRAAHVAMLHKYTETAEELRCFHLGMQMEMRLLDHVQTMLDHDQEHFKIIQSRLIGL